MGKHPLFKDVKKNGEATQGPMTLRKIQHNEIQVNSFARVKISQRWSSSVNIYVVLADAQRRKEVPTAKIFFNTCFSSQQKI